MADDDIDDVDETPSDDADVSDEPDPETPSGEDTPNDEDVSDDGQGTATPDEPEPGTEGTPPKAAKADGDDEPEDWKKLSEQYKGDKAKIAARYREVTNQNARMAAELKALKSRGTPPPAPKAEPAAPPAEQAAALKAIDDEVTALTKQRDAIPQRIQALDTEIDKLYRAVIVQEHALRTADDLDKEAIEAKLETLRERLESKVEKHQTLQEQQARLGKDIEAKGRERKVVERQAEEVKARQQQQIAAFKKVAKEFPAEIQQRADTHFKPAAAKLKWDPSEKSKSTVRSITQDIVGFYLTRQQHQGRVDVPEDEYDRVAQAVTRDLGLLCEEAAKAALSAASKPRTPARAGAARPSVPGRPAPAATNKSTAPAIDDGRTPAMRAARERLIARLGA